MEVVALVCGGRNFKNKILLYKILNLLPLVFIKIVNGAAKGADKLSTEWAKDYDVDYKEYSADWEKFKKGAGFIRNSEMLKKLI